MRKQLSMIAAICCCIAMMWACDDKKQVEGTESSAANVAAASVAANSPESERASTATTEAASEGPFAVFEFEEESFDFGTIKQGEVVEHVFKFKNVGEVPLVITGTKASCGCTTPSWPKDPIAPNEEGEIHVKFNSKGKMGKQNKSITISANVEGGVERISILTLVENDETSGMMGPVKKGN